MKFILGCLIGVCAVCMVSSWVWPTTRSTATTPSRSIVQDWTQAASVAAVLSMAPLVANANVNVVGSYADPNHPNCQRIISAPTTSSVSGGNKADEIVLTGTDGNPGCPADGSGKSWKLMGSVQGSNVFVDFSPKGGPKDLQGIYDETNKAIRWPDGNVWTQKD